MAKQNKPDHNRVAIYIRVSTVHQVDKDSIPMQRNDLVAYSRLMLNTDDYVIFEDAGYSGKNTDRPRYQEMMSQIRTGLFTHLLVWKIDRISRNLLDFSTMYQELKELGVVFVSKNEQFDTSTAMGEAMLKIILVFAELERNMTSERVQATMISRATQGLWNGGRIPYGYSYDRETREFSFREGEHELAVLIHDKYEDLRSLISECRYLNERGFRTRAGNLWNPVSIDKILRSCFYCGDYCYNRLREGNRQTPKDKSEWITIKDHHPAMVSREQKERIIRILNANSKICVQKNMYSSPDKIHIFGGIAYCSYCGRLMHSTSIYSKKDHWRYSRYTCPIKRKYTNTCPNQSVTDLVIGEIFFNYILNLLHAQRDFKNIQSEKQLEKQLIRGSAFSYASGIESSCLHDLYELLSSGVSTGVIYGKGMTVDKQEKQVGKVDELKKDKSRIERALDRLRSLYLFDENTMSEVEYISKRQELLDSLDNVNEQIGLLDADDWYQSISDMEFMQKAAEFLISQNLSGRNYVNYERLARQVGAEPLRAFAVTILDNLTISNGNVSRIVFRNGLTVQFIYKKKS